MRSSSQCSLVVCLLLVGVLGACAEPPASPSAAAQAPAAAEPPPPPPDVVPDLLSADVTPACVDCDEPFDITNHKLLLEKLAANEYVAELRSALYRQDIAHQLESKAHFDNCDFDSAIDYVVSLHDEAGEHVGAAERARAQGKDAAMRREVARAFFALGQALHAVQDFYAHSNFVEMQADAGVAITDVDIVAPWRPEAKQRIAGLRQRGLASGYVVWGFPKRCPAGAKSHGDLAKDNEGTKAGKQRVAGWDNLSQYRAAVTLAREASLEMMRDAFRRWPLLREVNGKDVAFDVVVDRRGLDGAQ